MIEPDPSLHHIFENFAVAQAFYDASMMDLSMQEDERAALTPPRQAHGGVWIIDRIPQ